MNTARISDQIIVPLPDGTQLSARIWFPEQEGRYPAILEYHPYPKRFVTADRDEIGHAYFAAHGYVSVRVDMRGAGESEGFLSDEYTQVARQDAVDVIEWLAQQPWCTGTNRVATRIDTLAVCANRLRRWHWCYRRGASLSGRRPTGIIMTDLSLTDHFKQLKI